MKKRIISLLLAVITVMQIVPWTMLPIIAEGDENADAITVAAAAHAAYVTYIIQRIDALCKRASLLS